MANTCQYCGKTYDVGHNVSHAKNRTRSIKRANLRERRVVEDGMIVRRALCTKCARTSVRPQDLKQEVVAKA